MKRFLLLALPIAIIGCDGIHVGLGHGFGPETKGNGKPKEESRTVGEYDKVIVGSAFNVEASEGKLGPIKVSADSNLLPIIKTEVKNRTLKVWIKGSMTTSSPLKLTLSTPSIKGFEASGATHVNLNLNSKHDLALGASGASDIKVNGDLIDLSCDLSGASRATFTTPSLTNLTANLSGASGLNFAGSVTSLNAELSGASTIKGRMHGNKVKVRLSGASSASLGKFTNVDKEATGGSSVDFGS